MSDTNEAVIAAEHLLGNLWFNLEALPLIAGRLEPDTVRFVVGGPVAMAYSEMCRLMRSSSERLSAGALENGLRLQGFDFDWLAKLQARVAAESVETLYNYAAEINNAADLRAIQVQCADAIKQTQESGAKADVVSADLLRNLAVAKRSASTVQHVSTITNRVIDMLHNIEAGNIEWGARTGFRALDKIVSLVDGDLVIVAGRPSQGKCLGKGTKVLMFDGTLKNVEDVVIGDRLMGPDSKAKTVLALGQGQEMMYWIHQSFGISYRVNESHILSLKRSKNEKLQTHGMIRNISVAEALKNIKYIKSRFKGYKVAVDFPAKPLIIDPYFIGLWLGDGTSSTCEITTIDQEVVEYLTEYARQLGAQLVQINSYGTPIYRISWGNAGKGRCWTLQGQMREMGLLYNKHIPHDYLVNSTESRLQLLAGIIDSDGYYAGHYDNGRTSGNYYEITLKDKDLAEQVKFLCDTLGFRTSINAKHATIKKLGIDTIVYRVRLAGDTNRIPTKIARKQSKPWTDFRDWTMSGIDIVPDQVDDYYGFELDGDGLFLLEDMTVTHNTSLWSQIFVNRAKQLVGDGEDGQVIMFSADDTADKLIFTMACSEALVDSRRIRNREATREEYSRVERAAAYLSSLPIYIDDSPSPTVESMYYRCAMLHAQKPIRLAGMDYMELVAHADPRVSDLQKVENAARGCKGIGNTMRFPFLMLSQLRKEVDDRRDKWPTAADVRYAGEAEADKMLLVMRPEHYLSRGETCECDAGDEEGVALVNIAKNKTGEVGMARLAFRKEYSRFFDVQQVPLAEGYQ